MNTNKTVKYPENLYLKEKQKESGKSVRHIAKKVGVSERIISLTIHGHYKGVNVVPKILAEIK